MTYFKSPLAGSVPCAAIPFSRKQLSVGVASILMAAAGLALLPSASVYAQSANTSEAQEQQDLEEVIVSGIRFSQRSALDRKKEMGTMSDSLVAEDIGAFPDKNIAEALQRIPGIQLNRDDGEGSTVSIRGVDPDLLRVEMNNVGAMGMAGSRAVDFRDMASELVKSLDVIKGSEARLTEGGIGGTIQINTRKPNEFKSNFLSASVEGQYNDLIGDVMPKFNITGVYKPTDRFGILLNVTGSDKSTVIHAIRNTEWNRMADYDNSPEKTSIHPDFASVNNQDDCNNNTDCLKQWWDFNPYLPRYGVWERDEKRISANTMLEYQFTDNLSGHVGYTYNRRDKTAHDRNLQFEATSTARLAPGTIRTDARHNVIGYEASNAIITNRTLNFAWDQETQMVETGFHFVNERFDITGLVATSKAKQDIDSREANISASGVGGITVDLNGEGLPELDFSSAYYRNVDDLTDRSNTFDVNDLTSYNTRTRFKYNPLTDETQEDMGKFDVIFSPESGFFTKFRAGLQTTKQSFANTNQEYNIIRDQGVAYNGIVWTQADHQEVVNGNINRSPKFFKGYDLDVDALSYFSTLDTAGFIDAMRNKVGENVTRNDIDQKVGNFDVEVETFAAYVQAEFATMIGYMPVSGNFGVRSVNTDTAANGDVRIRVIVDQLDENGNPAVNPETGDYLGGIEDIDHPDTFLGRKTVKADYNDVLPSVNVTFGLIPEKLELYVGAAKVMARPRIGDINVNANCTLYTNTLAQLDNTANVCTGGNPYLKPYRATQTDVALTWYPDENSIVSAVWFTKDITSWTIDREVNYDVDFFGDGRVWDVTQKVNGKGVDVQGLELQAQTTFSWLPGFWSGFGGSVNYTYMESKNVGLYNSLTGEELPFPSQSENSYNITGFYETDTWSARLAYNYRDEYLAVVADRSGNPAFTDAAGYLDAKFSYNIGSNMKVHFDARNLTGEVKTNNAGPGRMSTYDWAGREYAVGFSWRL